MATKTKKDEFLMYRGKPMVRNGNTIYYGFMDAPCVIVLQITSTREVQGMEIADRVLVQLVSTDPDARPREKIMKKAERRGLYNAIDIGTIWLERELSK